MQTLDFTAVPDKASPSYFCVEQRTPCVLLLFDASVEYRDDTYRQIASCRQLADLKTVAAGNATGLV